MKRYIVHIVFAGSLVCMGAEVMAQGVTLHSDPRLSVLIKKPHNVDAPPPAPVKHKSKTNTAIASNVAAKPGVTKTNTINVTATISPVKPGTQTATTPAPTTAQPLPMENGHVAGWTPPVHRKARTIYSGKGFRVQIYNGPDRQKAIMVKTEFMRTFPGVRTYLTYASPSFRVKVGDYRNRSDAVGMWKEANSIYNPSMIVPDLVTISTF